MRTTFPALRAKCTKRQHNVRTMAEGNCVSERYERPPPLPPMPMERAAAHTAVHADGTCHRPSPHTCPARMQNACPRGWAWL